MSDADFDDFLDSDDDALFVEASNNIFDNELLQSERPDSVNKYVFQSKPSCVRPESSQPKENNELPNKLGNFKRFYNDLSQLENTDLVNKNVSQSKTNSANPESSQPKENNVLPNKQMRIISHHFTPQDNSPVKTACNSVPDYHISLPSSSKTKIENEITGATNSVKSNIANISILNEKAVTPESAYINNRFTPGFTPQAKKRKLPGPAGLLDLFQESADKESVSSPKILGMDMEIENIVSSQYTPEHLSSVSWQKLQTAVSSCSNLHSTAKYYSIKRVLKESSKKKLPKHMIVPVLCVLLKKITNKGSVIISVFMDDTGEINGKIDAEVLSTYKEYLVEGAAFILQKVTFLCNMLILKCENLVSIYHPDNSEKHPRTLESILETSEPLKPIKCECPKLSHQSIYNNRNVFDGSSHISHKSGCISLNSKKLKNISNRNRTEIKNISNWTSKPSSSITKVPSGVKNMRSDAFLEDLLDEDNCLDEFDELLGNLDEKSFMEAV